MAIKKKKISDVRLNVKGHLVSVNSEMTEDEIESSIGFALTCIDSLDNLSKQFTTSNEQLEADNKELADVNNKLNFNIEIQVMMLNLIKNKIGDNVYGEIRQQVVSSPEYNKLKSRAGL